jgi:hypothetical protein
MIQVVKENVTDYASFVSDISHFVSERMGPSYDVNTYKVVKNNSTELDSLVIRKEGKNVAPNIYLMPYYEAYLEGISLHEITGRLCDKYLQSCDSMIKDDFAYSYEAMKSSIIYRLVSFERNKKLLSITPHIKYLDLAITFHCLVRSDDEGIGTIRITNEHMKLWETNLEELSALARRNTPQLFPASINSMEEVLKGILQEEHTCIDNSCYGEEFFESILTNPVSYGQRIMYILSNQKGINGASCMLYEEVLQEFSDQVNSDFYILPSSIHEIILIPYQKDMSKQVLSDMVREVNRTQVAPEEVLSDKVYLYSKKHHAIIM